MVITKDFSPVLARLYSQSISKRFNVVLKFFAEFGRVASIESLSADGVLVWIQEAREHILPYDIGKNNI